MDAGIILDAGFVIDHEYTGRCAPITKYKRFIRNNDYTTVFPDAPATTTCVCFPSCQDSTIGKVTVSILERNLLRLHEPRGEDR